MGLPVPLLVDESEDTQTIFNYRDEVLQDGPVAYWRLGETSGTTAEDETANNRDGSYVNSPSLNQPSLLSSDPNKSVSFNGSTQYVNVPDNTVFTPGDITVEAIAKPASVPSTQKAVVSKGASSSYEWILQTNAGGFWEFIIWDSGGAGIVTATGTTPIQAGEVYHLAATFDNASANSNSRRAKLYVNGQLEAEAAANSGTVSNTTSPVNIGRRADNVRYFDGVIDEVAIYQTILNAERIHTHFIAATMDVTQDLTLDGISSSGGIGSPTLLPINTLAPVSLAASGGIGAPAVNVVPLPPTLIAPADMSQVARGAINNFDWTPSEAQTAWALKRMA